MRSMCNKNVFSLTVNVLLLRETRNYDVHIMADKNKDLYFSVMHENIVVLKVYNIYISVFFNNHATTPTPPIFEGVYHRFYGKPGT